jgi:hypothetical protein
VKLKRDILDINARVDRNDQNKRAQVAAAVAAAKVPRAIAPSLLSVFETAGLLRSST